MRILVLCALVGTTLFTDNTAEARHRRRCCYTAYNSCCQTACNSYNYAPAAPCQGNACGVTGQVWNGNVYSTTAPVQAACAPAQPVTYSAGYAPTSDPNAVAPAPPPMPQQVPQPGINQATGKAQSPPPPEPINN